MGRGDKWRDASAASGAMYCETFGIREPVHVGPLAIK